jgi:hypothetical protein
MGRARTITRRPLAVLALALLLPGFTTCASPGGGGGAGIGRGRFPFWVEPVKQISLRRGRLGWGGVEVGMSRREAERAVGRRLPPPEQRPGPCGRQVVPVEIVRQPLALEIDASGEGRVAAIRLLLRDPRGEAGTIDLVRALKARFPEAVYAPLPETGAVPEALNPRPLYRLPEGGFAAVEPAAGLVFGELCTI